MKVLIITVAVIALIILIKLWNTSSDINRVNNHISDVVNSLARLRITMEFNEKFKYSEEFIKDLLLAQDEASRLMLNWFNCKDNKIIEEHIINLNKLLNTCTNTIGEGEKENDNNEITSDSSLR